MIPAHEALQRLKEGNLRYVNDEPISAGKQDASRRKELVDKQAPFAVILGCSDSRVPAELIFDQGLGDLFVIRVAGNVVTPTQLGSIEVAAQVLGARLVVVLGHSGCEAVAFTLKEMADPSPELSPNIQALVNRIKPGLSGPSRPEQDEAVRSNILASVQSLSQNSPTIAGRIKSGDLMVMGAEYSLETGKVEFVTPDTI